MSHQSSTARIRMAAALLLLAASGCGGYEGLSPAAYDGAKSLYNVCNRRAEDKLDAVESYLATESDAGRLAPHEARWLRGVVAKARAGDWEEAAAEARRMMEDQVAW
ncbi:hypothetical protein Mal64_23210 [Pseudobythopirellula maris]|uniref:Lipoprotein n=1 Tax=Pseudobythopirellula maris TaxID=2527991 RepID=A0A5C5ZRJ3_9BACT|nr:hypothetical protein [Pseudobythopirellula maris]TWT88833.1 hypothetical protein Mal64_23210 [Pseudobythopirellula maris]